MRVEKLATCTLDVVNPKVKVLALAFDVSQNMIEDLQMGEADTIVIESEETKILSMNIDNHRLSLFMEKHVNHDKLCKRLK